MRKTDKMRNTKQKSIYLLIMMCFMMDVSSQNTTITLTFQALDSATLFPVALDSVTVFNLTENCDTTLYDSVSVLTTNVTWPVRIVEQGSPGPEMMTVRQNSPNPFHGTTRVSLFLNIDAELNMTLSDNSRKTCAGHCKVYPIGWHLPAALGAGFRRPIIPPTSGLKENAMIWSSTEAANNGAWQIQLYFDMPLCGLFANPNTKPSGSSVRCLKN